MEDRLTARTRAEFVDHIETFLAKHGEISVRKLSAHALGNADTLPRYLRDGSSDIRFSAIDAVLGFIETYGG